MSRTNEESEVIGHYLVPAHGRPAQPLLHESTALFQDVISDKLVAVETAVESDVAKLNQFFLVLNWSSDAKGSGSPEAQDSADATAASAAASKASVMVKQRTLLMIAAHAGSLRVLSYLLAKGAEPGRKAPDGITAYEMALAGDTSQAPTAVAMMRDADSHPSSSTRSSSTTENHSYSGTDAAMRANSRDLGESEGSTYSTTDLTRPEYSTDDFRMFNFKVLRCSKRHAHDWRACPFAHPTENARRRDPREFKYCALACPDYKQGFCIRGDVCPYAHGVFECWLHPSRYRTQLCKDGSNCHRPVCFFAHSLTELRAPTYTWVPTPADVARTPTVGPNGTVNVPAATGGEATDGDVVSTSGGGAPRGQSVPQSASAGLLSQRSGSGTGVVCSPQSSATEAMLLKGISADSSGLSSGASTAGAGSGTGATTHCSSPRTVGGLAGGSGSGSGSAGDTNGCGSRHGSGSPTGSVSSKDGTSGCEPTAIHLPYANGNGTPMGKDAVLGKGGHGPNLTQPNPAAAMLGFTAPRMSNAFARRHGLNPRDNPMINLQKIALQSQQQAAVALAAQQQPVQQQQPAQVQQVGGRRSGLLNGLHGAGGGAASMMAFGADGARSGGGGSAAANGLSDAVHLAALHQSQNAAAAMTRLSMANGGGGGGAGTFTTPAFAMTALPQSSPHAHAHHHGHHHGSHHHMSHHQQQLVIGNAGGGGVSVADQQALLAAQLAALNMQGQAGMHHVQRHQQVQQSHHQHQQQQHVVGLTMGAMGVGALNGITAAVAGMGIGGGGTAISIPYMAAGQPVLMHHQGMYGAVPGTLYDPQQQHLIAAMSGTQAEV